MIYPDKIFQQTEIYLCAELRSLSLCLW